MHYLLFNSITCLNNELYHSIQQRKNLGTCNKPPSLSRDQKIFLKHYVKFSTGGTLFIFSYNEITAENFTLHKQHVVKRGKVIVCQRTFVSEEQTLHYTYINQLFLLGGLQGQQP